MIKQIPDTKYWIDDEGTVFYNKERERKPRLTRNGYYDIGLKMLSTGKTKWYRLNRLVAELFIPNPENKPFVNHIDGNKLNNNLSNLEWVTHQENMEHAKTHGLVLRGEANPNNSISEEVVEEICKLLSFGYTNKDIAESVGVGAHNVAQVRAGVCWTHISCKYVIPKRSRALSCSTIHWICKKIEEGLTQGQIIALAKNDKITIHLIKDIRRRRIYTDISKDYNF